MSEKRNNNLNSHTLTFSFFRSFIASRFKRRAAMPNFSFAERSLRATACCHERWIPDTRRVGAIAKAGVFVVDRARGAVMDCVVRG